MAIDVQTPDRPELTDDESRDNDADEDYHRDDIEAALADGAWAEGFEEWASETDLAESEFDLLVRHGLIEQFDFYVGPGGDGVDYHVPTLSDDAREALGSGADIEGAESELATLGRTVAERLEREPLGRDG
ncbi:hypothetical protein [Haloarcula laminariae]|uniref:hypothetical protein n=1 Tax=Haloarcula laminariae TaxID=2961577 RepID=UPI0021CA741E|nr:MULTISPECIES: hypothetical protein [Halomicroarcula]